MDAVGGLVTIEPTAPASNEEGVLCQGAADVLVGGTFMDPKERSTGLGNGVVGGCEGEVDESRRAAMAERRSCSDGRGECPRAALVSDEIGVGG